MVETKPGVHGVCVYISDRSTYLSHPDLEHPDLEMAWIDLFDKRKTLICTLYRPLGTEVRMWNEFKMIISCKRIWNIGKFLYRPFYLRLRHTISPLP